MKMENEIFRKIFWWSSSSSGSDSDSGSASGSGTNRKCCRPMEKIVPTTTGVLVIFLLFFVAGICLSSGWIDSSIFSGISYQKPLRCTTGNQIQTCSRDYPAANINRPSNLICPSYFKWIHEDLKTWKETGITKEMVEKAKKTANFRLVILNGKVYVEKYRPSFQTRDKFTLWGILQLLRLYPGKLPDLELMFNCDDTPRGRGPKEGPPALFRYCADQGSKEIVFPDWSFWGWVETNIKPWSQLLEEIVEGNKRTKWKDRVPFAYWRGNPDVGRKDLMACRGSNEKEWNTHLYVQDWGKETRTGFKQSNLAEQCTHRYKIYIEGWAWSVSEKYILACDSMTLFLMPRYYDFFTRGMVPLQHYWPIIRDNNQCASLKFAVEWGNNHTDLAQKIANTSSNFIREELKMDYVYDYMFHVLNEYSKLLRFKPTVPPGAVELCSETMACPATGVMRKFMEDSMVKSPSGSSPCNIPPPYDPSTLEEFIKKKSNLTRQVQMWQHESQNINKTQ
ncbi:O-glucosyltransferase rumi-like [Quillaja saponaria]|uniref:O-glucosyltransferase rumi-like n=2 Tax=Quillaja saponaria TaxID=32244 RepID=A0AAD7PPQ9_QUISA|nr:O-glucosyltransferase rumi-like [Quillaja saponaria]